MGEDPPLPAEKDQREAGKLPDASAAIHRDSLPKKCHAVHGRGSAVGGAKVALKGMTGLLGVWAMLEVVATEFLIRGLIFFGTA